MRRFVVLLSILSCLAACAKKPQAMDETMASASEAFDLSDAELHSLSARADKGDVDAAYKLGEYFAYVKTNRVESIHWFEIAAKAGNYSAMNALVLSLIGVNTEASCMQASYWLDKALIASPEKYIADNYLRERRRRLKWDGSNCQH